ncbi:DUF4397 domain-containing protein [Parapedobacter sp. 10938]|uniref:DUF4397 domain-containing protein n=1 Tax=Parapedobacter flavus TaxID=3110225 RepID=UPI002DB879DA|nr:DUF4397 domain-containing protein [Parapedobacter sp. 10938]MEC3881086.1 DUF4397 domain-containing protein [Parapedobacter sp. 10938]
MRQIGKVWIGRWFFAIMMVVTSAQLGGCLKDDNELYRVSAVRALNAVPGSTQLDVFLDRNKFNFDDDLRQDEAFAYMDSVPYKNAWPNNRVVSIVDSADYPHAKPLVQKTVNFIPGRFYSLYVVGYDELDVLYIEDDLTSPTEGEAKVRFAHLSPDAPVLDFEVETGTDDPLRIADKAFKETTAFVAVDGNVAYEVNFIEHSSGDVLHSFEFTPETGMIYTVWVRGLKDNTGDAALDFGHGISTH